ncbi:MAG: hypothetical protein KatS3mg103_0904 [Phycisphaerales bacterium]|nr:MAG: hypothetical protein KatS3mg103_0904 [Phycisphaerales bacterium]
MKPGDVLAAHELADPTLDHGRFGQHRPAGESPHPIASASEALARGRTICRVAGDAPPACGSGALVRCPDRRAGVPVGRFPLAVRGRPDAGRGPKGHPLAILNVHPFGHARTLHG